MLVVHLFMKEQFLRENWFIIDTIGSFFHPNAFLILAVEANFFSFWLKIR